MGGSETILIAEDEPDLRELTRIFLESYGYKVLDASGADQAIEKAEKFSVINCIPKIECFRRIAQYIPFWRFSLSHRIEPFRQADHDKPSDDQNNREGETLISPKDCGSNIHFVYL